MNIILSSSSQSSTGLSVPVGATASVTDGAKIILQRTPTAVMFTDDTINVKFKLCTPQVHDLAIHLKAKKGVL